MMTVVKSVVWIQPTLYHNAVGNIGFSNADRNKALAEGKKRVGEIAQAINSRQIMPVETELLRTHWGQVLKNKIMLLTKNKFFKKVIFQDLTLVSSLSHANLLFFN